MEGMSKILCCHTGVNGRDRQNAQNQSALCNSFFGCRAPTSILCCSTGLTYAFLVHHQKQYLPSQLTCAICDRNHDRNDHYAYTLKNR